MPRAPKKVIEEPQLSTYPPYITQRSYLPVLVILLMIASFLLGMLLTKVQYLEKGNPTTAPQQVGQTTPAPTEAPTITTSQMKDWAKEISLDTTKFNSCFDKKADGANIDRDTNDGKAVGVSGTPTFYVNGIQIVGAQPYSVFKQAIEGELSGTTSPTPRQSVDVGHLPSLGDKNAKVVMVEFSDFQCPFCKQFFSQTFSQIKKDYIDTGKVVMYYRHFPLDFHPLAAPFANVAECANDQGKFWQMHDTIFSKQG